MFRGLCGKALRLSTQNVLDALGGHEGTRGRSRLLVICTTRLYYCSPSCLQPCDKGVRRRAKKMVAQVRASDSRDWKWGGADDVQPAPKMRGRRLRLPARNRIQRFLILAAGDSAEYAVREEVIRSGCDYRAVCGGCTVPLAVGCFAIASTLSSAAPSFPRLTRASRVKSLMLRTRFSRAGMVHVTLVFR